MNAVSIHCSARDHIHFTVCSLVLPPEGQQPAAIGANRQLVGDDLRDAALSLKIVDHLTFSTHFQLHASEPLEQTVNKHL